VRIYNGIETDLFRPEAMAEKRLFIREEFSIGDVELVIGSVGRLVWQKGFEFFLQSMPALLRDVPSARFILVGEGPLRKTLEEQAASLDLGTKLLFTGQRNDIGDLMAAMDMVIIPSLLEGFPMVTLEAMAMEKPIIATAIDGITEQITDGCEGLLIPPRNPPALAMAMRRLANDPTGRRALGIAARRRVVRDFSVQRMIADTLGVYETL
jgi:glycosyltransferase involved in cell wall biosynthesis